MDKISADLDDLVQSVEITTGHGQNEIWGMLRVERKRVISVDVLAMIDNVTDPSKNFVFQDSSAADEKS